MRMRLKSVTPAGTAAPLQALDAACPRYVCVPTARLGGLGHRLSNMMQSLLVALDLGLPTLQPDLEMEGRLHGAYAGANDLFQVAAPFTCPESASAAALPSGWSARHIGLAGNTENGIWKDFPVPGFADELLPQVALCNTVFLVNEFWPYSMERARHLLLSAFQRHSLTGMRLRSQLRYNASVFTIAIHSRLGDIRPTPIDLQVATLRAALQRLDPQGTLPVEVWVFSEAPEELAAPMLAAQLPRTSFHFDTADMPALLTFMHLVESDVTIGSDSSFSWFAAYLARERPLFFTAPNARESPDFENFMAGNVRVSAQAVFDDHFRLAAAAAQWRASRPEALLSCIRSRFWAALSFGSCEKARNQRFDYIAGFSLTLHGLEGAVGRQAFDIAPPVLSGVCASTLSHLGIEGAAICGLEQLAGECTVLSLTHDLSFAWEASAVGSTGCHVHVFDCPTASAVTKVGASGRLHIHSVCLDANDAGDGKVKTLAVALRELNLPAISVLRLNLEGLEHVIVDDLAQGFRAGRLLGDFLPDQLLLHVRHTQLSWLLPDQQIPMGILGRLFLSLAQMGYSLVARQDSSTCPHCSVFTYVRTAC